jgi:hypothetical protein
VVLLCFDEQRFTKHDMMEVLFPRCTSQRALADLQPSCRARVIMASLQPDEQVKYTFHIALLPTARIDRILVLQDRVDRNCGSG